MEHEAPQMTELIPAACLAIATIYGEAANEPYHGKLAVAKVIRNRMQQKYFSDGSVAGTILKPLQFSLWNTSDPGRIRACKLLREDPLTVECERAWNESENSWPMSFGGREQAAKILLYHADYVRPSWAKRAKFVSKIGRHLFYELKPQPQPILEITLNAE